MQFQVPQFIETQDKIVGPLSLVQFGYIGGAGGAIFLFYFLIHQRFLFFFLSTLVLVIGSALAFIKISGRTLPKVLLSALIFYWKPQTYVWIPENPALKKDNKGLGAIAGHSPDLERLLSGMALKNTWQSLLGGSARPQKNPETQVRYEILQNLTGERDAVRRIDYRQKK